MQPGFCTDNTYTKQCVKCMWVANSNLQIKDEQFEQMAWCYDNLSLNN